MPNPEVPVRLDRSTTHLRPTTNELTETTISPSHRRATRNRFPPTEKGNRNCETPAEAGILAFKTGVDIETPDVDTYKYLKPAIESGKLAVEILDETVSRILKAKFLIFWYQKGDLNPYSKRTRT